MDENVVNEIVEAFDEDEQRAPTHLTMTRVPESEEQRLKKKKFIAKRAEQAQRRASLHLNKAIDTLARLMDSPNEMVARAAALAIVEHSIGKPSQRKAQDNDDDELMVIGQLPEIPE